MATRTVPVRPEMKNAVRALVDAHGIRGACRELDLAEATVARLAAGIPCSKGTAAVARIRLRDLELISELEMPQISA